MAQEHHKSSMFTLSQRVREGDMARGAGARMKNYVVFCLK
jgi:hypothetical protein